MNIEEGLYLARRAFEAGEPLTSAREQLRRAFQATPATTLDAEDSLTASSAGTGRPRTFPR